MTNKLGMLVTADGAVSRGVGFGAIGTITGELVFNTGMVGYQELLTDPSYAGQIPVATYPLIGNYGISETASESARIWAAGFIIGERCLEPVHRATGMDLDAFLSQYGIPGLAEVDTRSIVRRVRDAGVVPAALRVWDSETEETPTVAQLQRLAATLDYSHTDFVRLVSLNEKVFSPATSSSEAPAYRRHVGLIDYGAKQNIVRELNAHGLDVTIFPATVTAAEILAVKPDGLMLSNGPGDPALLDYAVETVRDLVGQLPIFGICLGNQILGRVAGAGTYKLKFGHRGGNHPVRELATGRVYMTSQNHGYAVDGSALGRDWEVTHLNQIDNTVEGLRHRELPVWSVQFHPEAKPGPRDTRMLFDRFVDVLARSPLTSNA